jgi:cold shock protein
MQAETARELVGRIKYFDKKKGYGFVASVSEYEPEDVMLHKETVFNSGFEIIKENALIHCLVERRSKGLHVSKVLGLQHGVSEVAGTWVTGTVKWFNRERGFGFMLYGSSEAFIHMETLRSAGLLELREGKSHLIKIGDGANGKMVVEIK